MIKARKQLMQLCIDRGYDLAFVESERDGRIRIQKDGAEIAGLSVYQVRLYPGSPTDPEFIAALQSNTILAVEEVTKKDQA